MPLSNKKKTVQANSDNDDDDDETPIIKNKSKRTNEWQPNTFFPIHFGNTSGGAIAVANSFSTGKGGMATSHATAYGSPLDIDSKRFFKQNKQ